MLNKSYFFVALYSFVIIFSGAFLFFTGEPRCQWEPGYLVPEAFTYKTYVDCPSQYQLENAINIFFRHPGAWRDNIYAIASIGLLVLIAFIFNLIMALRFPNICIELFKTKQFPNWPESDKYIANKLFGKIYFGEIIFILFISYVSFAVIALLFK